MLLAGIGSALFSWGSATMAAAEKNALLWGGAVFFGIGVPITIFALWRPRHEITLSTEGIHVWHRRGDWSLPWEDVAGIREVAQRFHGVVTYRGIAIRLQDDTERALPGTLNISQKRVAQLIAARIAPDVGPVL